MDNKEFGIIYIATNKINSMQYVGKTINKLKNRINKHLFLPKRFYFQRALKKYGKEAFKWEIIEYPIDKLIEMEIYWIKKLNTKSPNGYNLTDGGEGIPGYKFPDNIKKILSEKSKGNTSAAGRKTKDYLFIDPEGKEYIIDSNFNNFCKENNISPRSMSDVLNGKKEQVNGWVVKYAET